MRMSLSIGGALLALAAFASTADARMGGGGGMGMSLHGGGHASMSSSIGSPRGSNVDMRSSAIGGRAFNADSLQTRVKGTHWKHPIDSDNGGNDDPPKKPPKGSTQAGNGGGSPGSGPGPDGGWYQHPHGHPHYGPWPAGGSSGDTYRTQPAPASRTPR